MTTVAYKISTRCAVEQVSTSNEDAVVCSLPGGDAFIFVGTSLLIWELLSREYQSVDGLMNAIHEKTAAPREVFERDARRFLDHITQVGLVEIQTTVAP